MADMDDGMDSAYKGDTDNGEHMDRGRTEMVEEQLLLA